MPSVPISPFLVFDVLAIRRAGRFGHARKGKMPPDELLAAGYMASGQVGPKFTKASVQSWSPQRGLSLPLPVAHCPVRPLGKPCE